MSPPAVEIELKFICSRLNFLQFKPFTTRTIRFRDTYFDRVSPDSATPSLAAQDVWLRMRDNRWQLKVPRINRKNQSGIVRVYNEYDDETAIARCVAERLNVSVPTIETTKMQSLENWLNVHAGVERLTPFDTVRRSCILPSDPRFRIDLDYCPQLEYSIGEVEIIAPNTNDIDLLSFCRINLINVTRIPPPSKVMLMLQRYHPALYEQVLLSQS
jgi:hypothetical protein